MILEFLNLCFAVTAPQLEVRTINWKVPNNDDDDDDHVGLSEEMIRTLYNNNKLKCLFGATIKKISKLTNGSSSEAVFRIETSDGRTYIIKSTRAPFKENSWKEAVHLQQRGKAAEREIVKPQTAMANFIHLSNNQALIRWNAIESVKKDIRLLVSLPIELLQLKINAQKLHLEIFEAAPGHSLVECIKESDKTRHCDKLFESFGRVLARFHKTTGMIHGDLNITNVFVSLDGQTFTLIDGNSMHEDLALPLNYDLEKLLTSLDKTEINDDVDKLLTSLANAAVERPSLRIFPLLKKDKADTLAAAFKQGYYDGQKENYSGRSSPTAPSAAGYTDSAQDDMGGSFIEGEEQISQESGALNNSPPPQIREQTIY